MQSTATDSSSPQTDETTAQGASLLPDTLSVGRHQSTHFFLVQLEFTQASKLPTHSEEGGFRCSKLPLPELGIQSRDDGIMLSTVDALFHMPLYTRVVFVFLLQSIAMSCWRGIARALRRISDDLHDAKLGLRNNRKQRDAE